MSESNGLIHKPSAAIIVCLQVIMGIMPIVQLPIGALYRNDCPQQPYIPIYLLVMGVVFLLLVLFSILPCTAGKIRMVGSGLICFFLFCWFIAGNVWIYSIYEPNYNKTTSIDTYCDKTLYLFAFWTTNLHYILLGLIVLSTCCPCLG